MMIDQTTRGHDFLLREFNFTPSIAWQIDPFGHSSTQVCMLILSFTGLDETPGTATPRIPTLIACTIIVHASHRVNQSGVWLTSFALQTCALYT